MHEDWGERTPRWAGIRSEWVDVRGTAVHLLRADGPSSGPVQLLVHGLGGAAANWLDVMAGLAERGPVVAPDLPGFGRTEPPRPGASRVRANVGFLAALLHTLGHEDAEVHGNSMGGLISVLFAARRPELVRRLVLVDPALPAPAHRIHRTAPQTLLTFAPFVFPGAGRIAMRRLYAMRTVGELYEDNQHYIHGDPGRVHEAMLAVGEENLAFGAGTDWRLDSFVAAAESVIASLLAGRQLAQAVRDVQAPTLLVWGDHDKLIGRAAIDATARRRPDWQIRVLEGVGHAPMIEVPDDYLDVVLRWLDGVGAVSAG